MKKDLLAKLHEIKQGTPSSGVIRTLDEAELASVVGGMMKAGTRSDSCSGGTLDDCRD